jgi:hypothetical protein
MAVQQSLEEGHHGFGTDPIALDKFHDVLLSFRC